MSIRFSPEGPEFPEQLVDALLAGEVVFLCGAGVSAPQLPTFCSLVKECYKKLGVEFNPSEDASFKAGRYEEVLGSLSRRIVDPSRITEVVAQLLQPPKKPDFSHHHTILRLSRNQDSQPTIVTTNFDTLLERALRKSLSVKEVRTLSSAGQDLPQPGRADFNGIIHLHGRIADPWLRLEKTPLVITSADYGDAYMRSGWASRFLFDLCRCKTLVLVGYSASDAPVRYILHVLNADRQRFPDLRSVYAFTAVKTRDEDDVNLGVLSVKQVKYEYTVDSISEREESHIALWRDLDRLAELVESPPAAAAHALVQNILAKPYSDASKEIEHGRIIWFLRGKHDLWPVVSKVIEDASWFDFFDKHGLWEVKEAAGIIASWIGRDLQSQVRINQAIDWSKKLGKPFARALTRVVNDAKDVPPLWLRAWRLLSLYPPQSSVDREERLFGEGRSFTMLQILRAPDVLYADLEKSVDLLAPVLEISTRTDCGRQPSTAIPKQLSDLMCLQLHGCDYSYAGRLIDALLEIPQPNAIADIATAKLQAIIGLMLDTADTNDDHMTDYMVPSIEPHSKNTHRRNGGPIFLVQLLARLLPKVAVMDKSVARGLIDIWRRLPGKLGVRLWLHAQRNSDIYTADEAIGGLQTLPIDIFWNVRRELALVLRDRAVDACQELVNQVEDRILNEGNTHYEEYVIDPGQMDWRKQARDTVVWLRLNMLNDAKRLTPAGVTELAEIKQRYKHLDRDVEDRDFFLSYTTGIRKVVGDAKPIAGASDAADRLKVARSLIQSPDIEVQHGWSVYCRTDVLGALDILGQAPLSPENALLWIDFIKSLSFSDGKDDPNHIDLVRRIFERLDRADQPFLKLVAPRLADLYSSATRRAEMGISGWWPRLFNAVVADDTETADLSRDIYRNAINSPGGRLTEAALVDIDELRKSDQPINQELLDAIATASSAGGRQGVYARSVLIRHANFVVDIKAEQVIQMLNKHLDQGNAEGGALRSALVSDDRHLSATASKAFRVHILQGVKELGNRGNDAIWAADKILRPALSIVRKERNASEWGIDITETKNLLRTGPPALREGAAEVLKQWVCPINDGDGDPFATWRTDIRPLLDAVWPRERALCEVGLVDYFVDLAVNVGNDFPDALDYLLPYLGTPATLSDSTGAIWRSQVPESFPQETLTLLWKLFGREGGGDFPGFLPEILDQLITACPDIKSDRRLQSLSRRTIRYR
ncbi:SIR2 family protein [Verminephrobacter aporrectodeae]|uniref:SIR2 family protein n=1 Tax=Verminephrobacter aporrectodeae TaxID=1110389 RepID=UPI002244DA43|nr:SIR2 family protein [Verminephrobacter aporrectodeae]MCW8176086.1 hypothetical protein [Verminephrobacter aporrectodeae subsp. tuberculatae]MCW8203102.1 hypothetical protein [Verminephrobacter aporrectodeae subsp. tuberculatae]